MSRSVAEHLAVAPPEVRKSIVRMVQMVAMDDRERRRVLAPVARWRPELAAAVLDALPPVGLTGRALVDAQTALVVEQLGVEHGGRTWLADTGRWPLPTPDDENGDDDHE
jgi:hypothetical protein